MPNVKTIYWNIESFGDNITKRGNYVPLYNFIAQVLQNVDADVLCLQEFRGNTAAGRNRLDGLLLAINNAYNAVARTCDWYADWVPGGLSYNMFGPAYNPNTVAFSGNGRNEGYAVLWKQNLSKFTMQIAEPIDVQDANPPGFAAVAAGTVANTQSNGVRGEDVTGMAPVINGLGANFNAPAGMNTFILPAGTNIPAAGILDNMGMAKAGGGAGVLGGALNLDPGDVIPTGTSIGPGGLVVNNALLGQNPIAVPGGFTLTNDLEVPAAGATLIPNHALSLSLTGRQTDMGGNALNYDPAGVGMNNWELARYPSTAGAMFWNGGRRPSFCTIRLNSGAAVANELVPISMYHTPLSNPRRGLFQFSFSRPAYEAYDHAAPGYVQNARALMGGDYNLRLDVGDHGYTTFTNGYGAVGAYNGGANFQDAMGNQNIRVQEAAPGAAPAFPPTGMPLTEADNPVNKTTIQLNHPVIAGNRVLSNVQDHFKRLAIDNIFYRGFTAAQAPRHQFRAAPGGGALQQFNADVYDLMLAVSDAIPAGAVVAPLPAFPANFFIPAAIVQAFNAPFVALGVAGFASLENGFQMAADLLLGVFQPAAMGDPAAVGGPYAGPGGVVTITPERRAAEFIKLFVSDHLPVIFTMNV